MLKRRFKVSHIPPPRLRFLSTLTDCSCETYDNVTLPLVCGPDKRGPDALASTSDSSPPPPPPPVCLNPHSHNKRCLHSLAMQRQTAGPCHNTCVSARHEERGGRNTPRGPEPDLVTPWRPSASLHRPQAALITPDRLQAGAKTQPCASKTQ